MATYRDLLKYAATGIASPDMTYYDRMRASTLMGGAVQTLTGIPPFDFISKTGKPLISWSMKGNGQQTGTPTHDNPVMPTFCGVRTANLWDEDYTGANSNAIYRSVFVGDGTFTLSTTFQINNGITDIFLLPGIAKSGISSSSNGAYAGKDITTQSIDGYVTIAYRKNARPGSGAIDKCDTMLNLGSTAFPYEPYGWAEKITCAGQTVPIYLGQTQTVRRVRKLVLDGVNDGEWKKSSTRTGSFHLNVGANAIVSLGLCDRAVNVGTINQYDSIGKMLVESSGSAKLINLWLFDTNISLDDFKSYLAAQYAAGTPVVIWYALATPETGIVNEPLAKIGDYADELHSADAAVTIPTAKGQNTLTVETDLQPSEMTITGYIEESSPFPPDCAFECDLDYFIDDAIEWSIWSRTYTKLNDEYAVGAIVDLSGTGLSIALLMSPVSADAVAYRVGNKKFYSTGSITYNGKTWYYSDASYAEGRVRYSGLPLYETPMEYPYTQEQLTQFLQFINAKNR